MALAHDSSNLSSQGLRKVYRAALNMRRKPKQIPRPRRRAQAATWHARCRIPIGDPVSQELHAMTVLFLPCTGHQMPITCAWQLGSPGYRAHGATLVLRANLRIQLLM